MYIYTIYEGTEEIHAFGKYSQPNHIKDCLPYLFHSFRNKYFNKISLGNMLYFQNKLYKYEKMHGFPINMQ